MAERTDILLLSASMGGGHDQVAAELSRRFSAAGYRARTVDLLTLVPGEWGAVLRRGYRAMLEHAPWGYDAIYRIFFRPGSASLVRASPLTAATVHSLHDLVRDVRPRAVVSTFHQAGLAAGRLRASGQLACPSVVVMTDFTAHALWLHPGNDLTICAAPALARRARKLMDAPAVAAGPVVRPEFLRPLPDPRPVRDELGLSRDDQLVLVSGGSWGVGDIAATARSIGASDRYVAGVLCGRNAALARRLGGLPGVRALPWRNDVAAVLAGAVALVDNGGGTMATEAFAAGVPVVAHRPIPGHGRVSVRTMLELGVVSYAARRGDLLPALERAVTDRATVAPARRLFEGDAAVDVLAQVA